MSTTYLEIPIAREVDASAPPITAILMRLAAALVRKQCDTLFPHAFENALSVLVTTDDPAISSFRDLARFFNEQEVLENIAHLKIIRNRAAIVNLIPPFLERVSAEIKQFTRSHDDRETLFGFAKELDSAAIHLEKTFSHKLGGIVRRAELLRRRLRDELNVLVEDAVDEFEVDVRRLAEKKGWFGSSATGDLSERLVIKNLHRRYKVLAQRYQEHLDLLEREVARNVKKYTS